MALRRNPTLRKMPVPASFFTEEIAADEKPAHFLDTCAFCCRPLRPHDDIFMYKGDTPFCSEECRQEQIDMDDVAEKNRRTAINKSKPSSAAAAAARRRTADIPVPSDSVVAV